MPTPAAMERARLRAAGEAAIVRECARCTSRRGRQTFGGALPGLRPELPTQLVCAKGLPKCPIQDLWVRIQVDPLALRDLVDRPGMAAEVNTCADTPSLVPARDPANSVTLGDGQSDFVMALPDEPLTAEELRHAAEVVRERAAARGGVEDPVLTIEVPDAIRNTGRARRGRASDVADPAPVGAPESGKRR